MINLYKQATAVAITLLLSLFLLPACSDEEGGGADIPEAKFAKLTISLHSMDNASPAQTKASITEEDDSEYEHHIHDYRIIILKKGTDGSYKVSHNISGDDANNSHTDSETTKEVELEVGQTYKFYAFANLDELASGGDYIKGLGEGNELALDHAVEVKPMDDYYEGAGGSYIPMSSYGKEVKIEESTNSVTLQLIRLIGKVSVSVDNGTNGPITLNEITLNKFRTDGSIYLLPYDAAQGKETTLLEAIGNMTETYGPSFPNETEESSNGTFTVKTLLESNTIINAGANNEFTPFYANETRFTAANSGEALTIEVDLDGRDQDPKPTTFNFIRRNDWLKIPLLISDAETTISIDQQHMPIGGTPASYKLEPGLTVSSIEFATDHGGDITISYTVKVTDGTTLKYFVEDPNQSGVPSDQQYCSAVLESHTNNLLINVPEAASDGGWQADKIEFEMSKEPGLSGSFKVTAQELAYSASATIKLTLVVSGTKDGSPMEIVLPYTITITNGKTEKTATTKGGNS